MRYWKRINTEGLTTTVESYSFDTDIKGAVEITKDEFDAFIASISTPISRDLAAEVDALKIKVDALWNG